MPRNTGVKIIPIERTIARLLAAILPIHAASSTSPYAIISARGFPFLTNLVSRQLKKIYATIWTCFQLNDADYSIIREISIFLFNFGINRLVFLFRVPFTDI